jgi:hypothetical protein
MNDIELLRNEYRSMQRRGIAALLTICALDESPKRFYNQLVRERMVGLEPTPENWIRQARILTIDLEVSADDYDEYLHEKAMEEQENDHMGYDTLEERRMDREEW